MKNLLIVILSFIYSLFNAQSLQWSTFTDSATTLSSPRAIDLNNDGIYQSNENPGNDVGLDGVGPLELNYTGPDQGEGNHQPDYLESVGCEPNFAVTDVTESDMILSLIHI